MDETKTIAQFIQDYKDDPGDGTAAIEAFISQIEDDVYLNAPNEPIALGMTTFLSERDTAAIQAALPALARIVAAANTTGRLLSGKHGRVVSDLTERMAMIGKAAELAAVCTMAIETGMMVVALEQHEATASQDEANYVYLIDSQRAEIKERYAGAAC